MGILVGGFAPVFGAPKDLPRETWMGMYIGESKIGYMQSKLERDEYKGQPCYRLESVSRSRLTLHGIKIQQDYRATIITDESFAPLSEEFEVSSGGRTTKIIATFTDKTVECEIVSEGIMKKSIPIPEGASLVGDTMYGMQGRDIKVGDKHTIYCFNAITVSIDKVTTDVERKEKMEIGGTKYDTFVVRYETPLGGMTCWQTPDEEVVKTVAMMGITMQKETREQALSEEESDDYTPPSDFAVMTSVKADKDIKNPTTVRNMKIRLIGIVDKDLLITDSRQNARLAQDADPQAAEFHISAKEFDSNHSIKLGEIPDGMERYLAESPYIQVKNKSIVETAAEIVGETETAYEAACKIRSWLHKTMRPRADIGIPRSAMDVLKEPVGVCRDYATLFTALARAAGIPTRLVAGLVYMDGSFYYHAWAESFVGEWVPFDATLTTDVVDATHVKFTEGDATSMFLMSKIIGALKAEILEVR